MPAPSPARAALRGATADSHARVDAVFARYDLADRGDYARFLAAQAAAFLPVEAALEAGGVAALLPDWTSRRRSDALRADLAALAAAPAAPLAAPVLPGPPALLGAAYVLEGSRLGGAMLRRAVPAQFPVQFLSSNAPGGWRRLVAILDERLVKAEDIAAAAHVARQVFDMFEAGGLSGMKVDRIGG